MISKSSLVLVSPKLSVKTIYSFFCLSKALYLIETHFLVGILKKGRYLKKYQKKLNLRIKEKGIASNLFERIYSSREKTCNPTI
jgi:hypothetical protein